MFETKDANCCVLTLFKTFFLSWNCWEHFRTRTRNGACWRNFKRCCNCWEKNEIRPFYAAFWCNSNRYFGSCNCLAYFASKDAYWRSLTLFETMFFWSLNCCEKKRNNDALWCVLALFETKFYHFSLSRIYLCTLYCVFSHLKVIYFLSFQFKSLLEQVNKYASDVGSLYI